MSAARVIVLILALIVTGTGLSQLHGAQGAVEITSDRVGSTPVSVYRQAGMGPAPVVVIAHGFAGSRPLMKPYALTLAQAGYVAVSFDFLGHGRHPDPLTGDVDAIEDAPQLLMDQTAEVINYALGLDGVDGRVALLGHSMATDIIVRQAARDPRVGPVVAISMVSQAVSEATPRQLLMITGEWEGILRTEAVRVVRLVDPRAEEGGTATSASGEVVRRTVVAPMVEHVGVLYSKTGLRAARDWLNDRFGRGSVGPVAEMGLGIVLTLAGLVALAWPLSALLSKGARPVALTRTEFWVAALIPAITTPLLLSTFDTRVLPVLVADYLALHLALYGGLLLLTLRGFGYRMGRLNGPAALGFAVFGILIFGGVLDRYVVSFVPAGPRPLIVLAVALGAIPYMIGEARLLEAGHAGWARALTARTIFLASLAAAVALDFERLYFLLIILPVIVLFFLIFGLIGGWVGRRTGSSIAVGLGAGAVLAWALAVTFPLFVAG